MRPYRVHYGTVDGVWCVIRRRRADEIWPAMAGEPGARAMWWEAVEASPPRGESPIYIRSARTLRALGQLR